ncbi:hypothetical protein CEXT_398211 [Caerostris extrusa]|uniref:Uncharacterized protein n=1 Tax=Caerostris extrusa TaxID=172846 RepID=A0AAV4NGB9_CAEEX|nr:hypothetical protein CEXT_398211 [Caerostris extrusa]
MNAITHYGGSPIYRPTGLVYLGPVLIEKYRSILWFVKETKNQNIFGTLEDLEALVRRDDHIKSCLVKTTACVPR